MMSCFRRVCLVVLLLAAGLQAELAGAADHYWELGAGNYNLVYSDNPVDEARWDWLVLSQSNAGLSPEMIRSRLNRNLAMNPRQRYVIELAPLPNLGTPNYDVGRATFLEYHFHPEARKIALQRIRDTIKWTLETISKPENVYAFSLEEELPACFGIAELGWTADRDKVPPKVEEFRAEIEKERGKPMVWDDETRLWLGKLFTDSLEEIHQTMKEAMGPGHKVLYWHHGGFTFMDERGVLPGLAADAKLQVNGLYPCKWSDICKPGVVEALMGWPDHPIKWNRTLWIAEKFGLPFFTQVNHNAILRLDTWPECLKAAKTRHPLNLGYFYFCSVPCSSGAWNDDLTFPPNSPENNSQVAHIRRVCAQEEIGTPVVEAAARPQVEVSSSLSTAPPGGVSLVNVLVRNPVLSDLFGRPEDASAQGMEVTLGLPRGCRLEARYNFPATVKVGDLGPEDCRSVGWYVTVDQPPTSGKYEITIGVKCRNRQPVLARFAGDRKIVTFQPHDIWRTGYRWVESCLDGPAVKPWVTLEALKLPVTGPSVSDGITRLTYPGTLSAGRRLVISPQGKARLHNGWLLAPEAVGKPDAADPTGYAPFTEGYGVSGKYLGKSLVDVKKLKVTADGKIADGSSCIVFMQFATDKGWADAQVPVSLGEQWGESTGEVEVPANATRLERLSFYRGGSKGKVWYGKVSVRTSDLPAEGQEMPGGVIGVPPTIPGGSFRVLTYSDQEQISLEARMRLQMWAEEPKED